MTAPLALTMGDPAGIGPEITAKAWQNLCGAPEHPFFVIGCQNTCDRALKAIGMPSSVAISDPAQAIDIFEDNLPILPIDCPEVTSGKPNKNAAGAITKSIEMAVSFALRGDASAVVTNPIAKEVLYKAGFSFPGHTEYLADLTADFAPPYARGPVMMLAAKDLRVALVTIHMALEDVPKAVTKERIMGAARVLHGALITDMAIKNPRIAMAGLNPHAGENGALGTAERDMLIPTAKILRDEGINITDPQPADTLFHAEARAGYDAVLAMYHDQGLIPVKTLDFHGGVNITLGLPILRTSPDHGTAFDIAGRGIAQPDSLLASMKSARAMATQRENVQRARHG